MALPMVSWQTKIILGSKVILTKVCLILDIILKWPINLKKKKSKNPIILVFFLHMDKILTRAFRSTLFYIPGGVTHNVLVRSCAFKTSWTGLQLWKKWTCLFLYSIKYSLIMQHRHLSLICQWCCFCFHINEGELYKFILSDTQILGYWLRNYIRGIQVYTTNNNKWTLLYLYVFDIKIIVIFMSKTYK